MQIQIPDKNAPLEQFKRDLLEKIANGADYVHPAKLLELVDAILKCLS